MINVRPAPAAVWVTKSASQSVGRRSWIQLTGFNTELFDVGSYFASDTYTPVAGKYVMGAWYLQSTGLSANAVSHIAIYKNTVLYAQASVGQAGAGCHPAICIQEVANGTDAYNVYCWIESGTGTVTVAGGGFFAYKI